MSVLEAFFAARMPLPHMNCDLALPQLLAAWNPKDASTSTTGVTRNHGKAIESRQIWTLSRSI
jgi:hypothetical protein